MPPKGGNRNRWGRGPAHDARKKRRLFQNGGGSGEISCAARKDPSAKNAQHKQKGGEPITNFNNKMAQKAQGPILLSRQRFKPQIENTWPLKGNCQLNSSKRKKKKLRTDAATGKKWDDSQGGKGQQISRHKPPQNGSIVNTRVPPKKVTITSEKTPRSEPMDQDVKRKPLSEEKFLK